jgi:hypothetical protein
MTALKVAHTFELRPTAPVAMRGGRLDELMIDWRALPHGTVASLYFPVLDAAALVAKAATMYGRTTLAASDAHTVMLPAENVTYMPIPASSDGSIAGLLTVELPAAIRTGQRFSVEFLQLMSGPAASERHRPHAAGTSWRRVRGTFQLFIPVVAKESIAAVEERQLSVLRRILAGIEPSDRNYLTFQRYVEIQADRVKELGGEHEHDPPSRRR